MHALISLIFYISRVPVATTEHSEPLLLENHVCVIALQPDLQSVSVTGYGTVDGHGTVNNCSTVNGYGTVNGHSTVSGLDL